MPRSFDLILVLCVVVGLALRAWLAMRALRRVEPARLGPARRRAWARAILTQWLLVAVIVAWWIARRRPFAWLAITPHVGWGFAGVTLGVALAAAMLAGQRRRLAETPDLRGRMQRRLAGLRPLLPASRAEWPGFVSLAITAGVCEEVLFRGFVTWMLLHWIPLYWPAVVAQGVLFGLAHAYQGPRGVFATGAVGVFMGVLVWLTGSLWASMLLHALMDLHAGDLAVRVAEVDPAGTAAAARA